jgi:16S rRNA (uracil1498-N3)-methyltransferase
LSLSSLDLPTSPDTSIVLAVGPEGGWEKEELAQALDTRFTLVTLGRRILRAETAAIAAISIVQSRLGELG